MHNTDFFTTTTSTLSFAGSEDEPETNLLTKELQAKLWKKHYDFVKTKHPLERINSKEYLKYKNETADDSEKVKLRLEERKKIDFK